MWKQGYHQHPQSWVGTYRPSSSSLLTVYKVNETGKLLTDSFKVSAIF